MNQSKSELERMQRNAELGIAKTPWLAVIHNHRVVQSRPGWKTTDVLRATADARKGVIYDLPTFQLSSIR